MTAILLLGLLVGAQHALEADHIAAVASLAARNCSFSQAVRMGAAWGAGHSLTLALFGGAVLLLEGAVPDQIALALELAVGFMLIALGFDLLHRMIRERVHFHAHWRGDREPLHGHGRGGGGCHAAHPHEHDHLPVFPLRSLMVGMMHGMAGSAALIILALKSATSPLQGVAYILLFGAGSIMGMTLLAAAISLPLRYSARTLTWAHNGLQAVIGVFTISLGSLLVYRIGLVDGLLLPG